MGINDMSALNTVAKMEVAGPEVDIKPLVSGSMSVGARRTLSSFSSRIRSPLVRNKDLLPGLRVDLKCLDAYCSFGPALTYYT